MERLELNVQPRSDMRKSHIKRLKTEHWVPGNIFGLGKESVSVEVHLGALAGIMKAHHGGHSLISLSIGETKKRHELVVIQTLQKDPLTRRVQHVDFQRVSLKEKITTSVPIVLTGEARGVVAGGMLEHVLHEVHVRCLPDHIPDEISVDVSDLEIGQHTLLGEITPPEDVEFAGHAEDVIVAVRARIHVVEEVKPEVAPAEAPAEEPSEES